MVTNGNFDTDLSSWFGVNWVSLGGGQAYPAGTQPLTQTIAGLEIGSTYKCEINITKCDGSYITITLGDSVNEVQISTSGLHTIYFTPISTAGPLRILPTNGNATAFFTIDSIRNAHHCLEIIFKIQLTGSFTSWVHLHQLSPKFFAATFASFHQFL
jgi:hypothetical protein